jgi:hypothetical protein
LPEKLAENIHLLCTTPNQLAEALKDPRLFSPTPFPKAEPQLFANYMQQKVINQL